MSDRKTNTLARALGLALLFPFAGMAAADDTPTVQAIHDGFATAGLQPGEVSRKGSMSSFSISNSSLSVQFNGCSPDDRCKKMSLFARLLKSPGMDQTTSRREDCGDYSTDSGYDASPLPLGRR